MMMTLGAGADEHPSSDENAPIVAITKHDEALIWVLRRSGAARRFRNRSTIVGRLCPATFPKSGERRSFFSALDTSAVRRASRGIECEPPCELSSGRALPCFRAWSLAAARSEVRASAVPPTAIAARASPVWTSRTCRAMVARRCSASVRRRAKPPATALRSGRCSSARRLATARGPVLGRAENRTVCAVRIDLRTMRCRPQ
jgi:hypothetical protein